MADDTQMEGQTEESSPKQSPKCSPPQAKHPITVESSLAAIAELIKEVEADDPPIEVEAKKQTRNTTHISLQFIGNTLTQLREHLQIN
jgi:hypothetical protein